MDEQNLYQRGKVTITPTKFTVANKTYTIRNIVSASVEAMPANKIPLIMILLAGVLIMLVKDMLLVGAAIVVIGIVFYVLMKDEYSVRISHSSGDTADTFNTKERALAEEVANALNEAIGLAHYAYYANENPRATIAPAYRF